jgi:hypothetical protein
MSFTDDFMSGGGEKLPAFKFNEIGDTVKGQIIDIDKLEDRRPDGTPNTWDDGSPKHVWVFKLDTSMDGTADTALWVRGNMVTAIRGALADAGLNPSTQPTIITVKHHELGEPKRKGYHPAKLFKAKAEPGQKPAVDMDDF